jgi:hypothetical protein
MRKTDRQLVLGREHEVTSDFVGYADDSAQEAECWLAAGTRIAPGRHSRRRQGGLMGDGVNIAARLEGIANPKLQRIV